MANWKLATATAIMSQTEDLEKTNPTRDHVESAVKDLANDERVVGFPPKSRSPSFAASTDV